MTASTPRSANLRGSFWMVAAMAGFALEDAFIKLASGTLALGPIVAVFGLLGFFIGRATE